MGRHSENIIIDQTKSDLDALSVLPGDRKYFFGDKPCSIDAGVFGFLGVSVCVNGDNPLHCYGASINNLIQYCQRMHSQYLPETLIN